MAKKRKVASRNKFNSKPRLMKGGKEVMSALDKIAKLMEQIEEAKSGALEELGEKRKTALQAVADIDKEISALTGTKTAGKTGITRQRDPNAVCKVCGEKGHDARRHRGDAKKKR